MGVRYTEDGLDGWVLTFKKVLASNEAVQALRFKKVLPSNETRKDRFIRVKARVDSLR